MSEEKETTRELLKFKMMLVDKFCKKTSWGKNEALAVINEVFETVLYQFSCKE